jgi:peptidylprolyl isomerase
MRWITHCRGVASMARRNIPRDSANSQFFIMFDHTPSLDRQYSAWGRVILGQEHVDAIARGSPPDEPTRIASMQVASDVEESARWSVEVVDTASDWFQASISEEQRERLESYGGRVSICDLMPPGRRSGGN